MSLFQGAAIYHYILVFYVQVNLEQLRISHREQCPLRFTFWSQFSYFKIHLSGKQSRSLSLQFSSVSNNYNIQFLTVFSILVLNFCNTLSRSRSYSFWTRYHILKVIPVCLSLEKSPLKLDFILMLFLFTEYIPQGIFQDFPDDKCFIQLLQKLRYFSLHQHQNICLDSLQTLRSHWKRIFFTFLCTNSTCDKPLSNLHRPDSQHCSGFQCQTCPAWDENFS